MEKKFLIGANVFVVREQKILLGKRLNGFGEGSWGLPGGHVEIDELLAKAAARELLEETGMTAERLEFAHALNLPRENMDHYVLFGFLAINPQGEPELREPDRCEEWRWFSLSELPDNIVFSHAKQILLLKEKKSFSE